MTALTWFVKEWNQQTSIDTQILIKGSERKLKSEHDVAVFRIIQEALSNVRRHSEASNVVVTLEFAPASLQIMVRDDGKGFNVPKRIGHLAAEGKLGLIGMHQRSQFLGGAFHIDSSPGKGTSISVHVNTQALDIESPTLS